MNNKFKIGDKVRCIDTNWQGRAIILPVYQGIYTVKEITDDASVYLYEIPIIQQGIDCSFLNWHFVKATESGRELIVEAKERIKVKEYQNN